MFSFITLFIVIIATLYVALVYVNTSIMLIVYMEAAFFVLSLIYVTICRFAVRGKMRIPVGISEIGKDNLIKLSISNRSFLPVVRIKAYIVINDTINQKKKKYKMKLNNLLRGENDYINNISFPVAGNYEVALKKLRVYDMTGIMYRNIPAKSYANVQIMPKIYDAQIKLTSVTTNFYGESDVYDEHSPGYDNNEIFQIREYQKGDRLQNIHWKMTAKQENLMVKEQSLPKACPVVLFLDFRPDKRKNRLMGYLELIVSISFSLMDAGCAHYIVWFDSEKMDISRLRVSDEESLFYFIGLIMKVKWSKRTEDIIERYKQKYRAENYVWGLSLNERFQLVKENGEIIQFDKKELKESLSKVEIIL